MTTVTYTANFAGDFTTLAAAITGLGPDLTATSTGNVLGSGSTTTVIQLAAGETKNFLGHPLTIGATTCLITSYNTSTKVATVSARAGFTAAFPSAPSSGTAYTIANVQAVLNVGQSASGNNNWAISTGLSSAAIVTSAACTLVINGVTPWRALSPLQFNAAGVTSQAVSITSSDTSVLTIGDYTTVSNLGAAITNINGSVFNYAGSVSATFSACFATLLQTGGQSMYANNGTGSMTINNCVAAAGTASNTGFAIMVGTGAVVKGTTVFGTTYAGYHNGNYTDCAFYGTFQPFPYGDATCVRCACDQAYSGCTVITTPVFGSTSPSGFDFRPLPTSGLLTIGGVPALTTDIYGVTRSSTASTIGAAETAIVVIATQNITYSIGASGDLPSPMPNGAVSSLTWSSGTATLVTSAPHGIPVGNVVPLLVGYAFGNSGFFPSVGIGGYACWAATATNSTTFTYSLVSNPGTAPAVATQWSIHGLNYLMGGVYGTADLTFSQSGFTCPSTASSTSTIVLDSSTTSACLGHPIQWKTGAIGLIMAYNTVTHVATIQALAGYPANFGGTPQAGDAYTIFPVNVTFNIGPPSSGHTIHIIDIYHYNAAIVSVGPGVITGPSNAILVQGTIPFDPNAAIGTVQDGVSAIAIQLGTSVSGNADHTAVLGLAADYTTIKNLQIWDACLSEPDGCIIGTGTTALTANKVMNCLLRSDGATNDEAHSPFLGQSGANPLITFENCVMVSADFRAAVQIAGAAILNHCTVLNTANVITTTVGDTPVGSTAITVASIVGIQSEATDGSGTAGSFMIAPSIPGAIPYGANVATFSGNTLNMQGGATTIDIPAGTVILAQVRVGVLGQLGMSSTVQNSVFFGLTSPAEPSIPITFTSCRADANLAQYAGVGLTSYPGSVRLGSGAFGGRVDARPQPGNNLQSGTYMVGVPTDIFGRTRRNPPTIGAMENTAYAPLITFG